MYPEDTIYFYAQTERYAEFSNFAPYGVALDGVWWPTTEHFFQAQKFMDADYREKIRREQRPKAAKELGMTRAYPLRADWEEIKDDIMHRAVLAKFQTHAKLAALLLSTGDKMIVENAPWDAYWGCGPDGTGQNKLGQILMTVREQVRQQI
ncbi:NADAR family protein [Cypionkella sp.]|uniref:NADAR family protein n=1 Tax=Cypionkella sp. TaxID=2811411 RepID=UPI002ABB5764|nr:NADAR family protein [Cypionkella sp.]MDZ4395436.1 NADAR family protein [Cypionkella sp.]